LSSKLFFVTIQKIRRYPGCYTLEPGFIVALELTFGDFCAIDGSDNLIRVDSGLYQLGLIGVTAKSGLSQE